MSGEIPEADRAPGAPHPREARTLVGQDEAERAFLDAYGGGRLHHAWLVAGPRGVGKATLAWRIARFLLAGPAGDGPPATLDADESGPVATRMRALSEPRLFLLRRPWDPDRERLRAEITVDEVRRLKDFFSLSAADGGRRVVIVDAAEEMNPSAANATLKLLEEPPDDATILLVSHQPSSLLPTIRSRCRTLRCRSLGADEIGRVLSGAGMEAGDDPAALAALANGSPGAAFRLIAQDGLDMYARIVGLFRDDLDRHAAHGLSGEMQGAANAAKFDLALELFDLFLSRLARSGLERGGVEAAKGEAALFARLCPSAPQARGWAELQQEAGARARRGRAVNLDPATLVMDMCLKIRRRAADMAA